MTIQLSNAARESIRDFVSVSVTLNTKQTKMVDTLVADGVTHEMCFAPKGDAPREFYDSICEAVTLGILKASAKTPRVYPRRSKSVIGSAENRAPVLATTDRIQGQRHSERA
jgi:hypothetical protein